MDLYKFINLFIYVSGPCKSNENIVEKIEPKQYIEHQQYSIELKLDSSEIAQIRLHIYSGIRQRFHTTFTRIFNKKFEEYGVNCNLKCNNNWFTSSNSEKGYCRSLYKYIRQHMNVL